MVVVKATAVCSWKAIRKQKEMVANRRITFYWLLVGDATVAEDGGWMLLYGLMEVRDCDGRCLPSPSNATPSLIIIIMMQTTVRITTVSHVQNIHA